jgi:hypothetical protein
MHKQVPVLCRHSGEHLFSVDENLKPLIQFFWNNGIYTDNSCEQNVAIDDSGIPCVWVSFEQESFNELLRRDYANNNASPLGEFLYEHSKRDVCWQDDGHPNADDTDWIPGPELFFSVSVRFLPENLATFERLCADALLQEAV